MGCEEGDSVSYQRQAALMLVSLTFWATALALMVWRW